MLKLKLKWKCSCSVAEVVVVGRAVVAGVVQVAAVV